MKLPPFELEEFFFQYEFKAPLLFCSSDAETWSLQEILGHADSESLQLWDSLRLGYTEAPGLPMLRDEIAGLYRSVKAHHITTFAGAEDGIYCALQALISPNDHVVVVTPCYQSLLSLPTSLGARVTTLRLQCRPEGWSFTMEELERAVRPDTKR